MGVLEDVSDRLAQEALDLEERLDDEKIVPKIADALGKSSPTMEEHFLTAVRIRRAERRAQKVLDEFNATYEAKMPRQLPAS
ncbi:MAG: hypothetical protein AAFQ79_04570 [Pseudomonadota bacterium]